MSDFDPPAVAAGVIGKENGDGLEPSAVSSEGKEEKAPRPVRQASRLSAHGRDGPALSPIFEASKKVAIQKVNAQTLPRGPLISSNRSTEAQAEKATLATLRVFEAEERRVALTDDRATRAVAPARVDVATDGHVDSTEARPHGARKGRDGPDVEVIIGADS